MARKKKLILVDDEAEEETEQYHVDDQVLMTEVVMTENVYNEEDEDEYEEDLDAYEDDGFVVNNDEQDEEEENYLELNKTKKRRKRKSLKSCALDEDDVELIEENSRNFHQQSNLEITKFKRLRRTERDSDDLGASSAFSDYKGTPLEDEIENDAGSLLLSGDEDDEMDDFIVNDEMAITAFEDPTPISVCFTPMKLKRKKKRKQAFKADTSLFEKSLVFNDDGNPSKLPKQGEASEHKANDTDACDTEKKDDRAHNEIDVPERMMICEELLKEYDSIGQEQSNFEEEGLWILKQLNSHALTRFPVKLIDQIDKEDIVSFLKLYRVKKYDTPFIAMYRKEQCRSLLKTNEQDGAANEDRLKWHKVLWAVAELHRMWLLLQNRKNSLLKYYHRHSEGQTTLNRELFESIITSLGNSQTENDVNDVEMKFMLHFPPVEIKRPKWRSFYDKSINAGLQNVARMFGINSEQFGSLFTLKEPNDSPKKMASNFTCSVFETPEAVLKGARHVAALEISCEPCIRSHVRRVFLEKAVVSTKPTPKGEKIIDSLHPFAKVKWLHEKPILRFCDVQWLLIEKAEEEKLIEISIKLSESSLNHLRNTFRNCYLSDGLNESGRLWNEQRRFILEDALFIYLLPCMEKEARKVLAAIAKRWLRMEYGKQLWGKVSVAPYKHKESNMAAVNAETAPRVLACCWGPGIPETTCVMLDSTGEVLEVLHIGYLSSRSQNAMNQQRKRNEQDGLLNILRNHQPHVVVIGAENAFCTELKDNISELIRHAKENFGDDGHAMHKINVVYGDVSLPHLYEHSQISTGQLPEEPGIVKRAVALGRYLQNPLTLIATLCDSRREILNWKLTSFDDFLSSNEKYEMIEQVMVDITNQVGFDINFSLNHDWLFATLQFISGIGLQKAVAIKKALVGAVELRKRTELTDYGLSGKNIFHNAVGFLRIRNGSMMDIDVLDSTRIHPESYSLAEDFAKAVHSFQNQDGTFSLHNLMANPNQFREFITFEFVHEYMKERGEDRIDTVYDVITELLRGFEDPRKKYKELTQDEVFGMIVGDNKDLIAEGRMIQATVRHILAKQAICVLDTGLTGILSKDDFSDDGGKFDLKNKLHEGDTLACKIKAIDRSKCTVFLSCKESELKSGEPQDFHGADPFYREAWSKVPTEKCFIPRDIFHPKFQNVSAKEAVEFLADKVAGEYIFRPSLRGVHYLTLTLKVSNGVYADKDLIEDEKDQTDLTDLLRLGSLLKLGDDEFGNLYEVMDRYIDPVVTLLKAMLSHVKFKMGSTAEVDNVLRAERPDYLMGIRFCFSISRKYPGNFVLSYIGSTGLHHEWIGLHPKGFKFRKHIFESIDQLVASFQYGFDDLEKDPSARVSSVVKPLGRGRGTSEQTPFYRGKDNNMNPITGDTRMKGFLGPGQGPGSFSYKDNNKGQEIGYARGKSQGYRGVSGRGRGYDRGRGRGSGHKSFGNAFDKSKVNIERWPAEFKGNGGGLIKGRSAFSSVEPKNERFIANRGGYSARGRGRGGKFSEADHAGMGTSGGRGRGNAGLASGFGGRGRGQSRSGGRAFRGGGRGRGGAPRGGRGRDGVGKW